MRREKDARMMSECPEDINHLYYIWRKADLGRGIIVNLLTKSGSFPPVGMNARFGAERGNFFVETPISHIISSGSTSTIH
jgi:hypothetical protein